MIEKYIEASKSILIKFPILRNYKQYSNLRTMADNQGQVAQG